MIGRIINYLRNYRGIASFYLNHAFQERKLSIIDEKSDSLVIIGNGPSVSSCKEEILSYENADYMVVNFFLTRNELFQDFKPKYACMVDPDIFKTSAPVGEEVKALKDYLLTKVDWDMTLITPWGLDHDINNPKIKELKINNNISCKEPTRRLYPAMKNNLLCPGMWNIANAALYAGIVMGYRKIFIYGIDMTFFRDFYVDENNHIILSDRHFYGENKIDYTERVPEIREKGILRIFETNSAAFKEFRWLRKLADIDGCTIINRTPGSYVDAFERR